MSNRFLLALGMPISIIFGYPDLMEADTPAYYSYISIIGLILICIYLFVRARRKKK